MSLSVLVGGAECGPSNPLQSLTKRFDQDRGAQQDVAGPSRSRGPVSGEATFRSQHTPVPELQQDAARFFGAGPAPVPPASQVPMSVMSIPAQPFDVAGLRDALPAATTPMQRAQIGGAANAAWAADFLAHQPTTSHTHTPTHAHAHAQQSQGPAQAVPAPWVDVQHGRVHSSALPAGGLQSGALPWSPAYAGYGMSPMIGVTNGMAIPAQRHVVQSDQVSWDKVFQSQESLWSASTPALSEALPQQQQEQQQNEKGAVPADEMARLAARVIDSVKHEQNPKFQKSEFMDLMRQLRDGEVTVEEDNIVSKEAATRAGIDVKGKGRAVVAGGDMAIQSPTSQSQILPSYQGSEELNAAYAQQAKDPHEAYFRQENTDFTEYWNAHHTGPAAHTVSDVQRHTTWHEMQRDWDAFEATTTGIEPVSNYQFQTNNPCLLGDSSQTRHHSLHMSHSQRVYESVLELEAAVQRDPSNATAWFELGVKQQENEREAKAIQALQRATELDPTHLSAWLALSVSYTNDNNRLGAYDAIRQWVLRNPKYEAIVSGTALATDRRGDFAGLIDTLIQLARRADQQGGGVDAEVQVALAVLLNTTEEYSKAVDCFLTALAVRPDDWLLYNRVGATMANNGKAADALEYYYRALDLNPAYIRARFNLGISCINLQRYEEAASHILDALVLQDSDGVEDGTGMNDARGLTTSTLWESLKTTCLHLQRVDLAAMCDRRDLNEFRRVFQEA